MRVFKALQVPDLTPEIAAKLEYSLEVLTGVEAFKIAVENKTLSITFDEQTLPVETLAATLAEAGCPLRNMRAVLFQ